LPANAVGFGERIAVEEDAQAIFALELSLSSIRKYASGSGSLALKADRGGVFGESIPSLSSSFATSA